MAHVTVIGSINQDITVTTERFPGPGETLLGRSVSYRLGGKGANQAAAAARAGAEVAFVGAVGSDDAGSAVRAQLAEFGVDVEPLAVTQNSTTGTAHITVDSGGENTILVVPGANGALQPGDIAHDATNLGGSQALVLQCEIPTPVNLAAINLAREAGVDVILNLAPAIEFPREALAYLSVLVVNETEAALVLGDATPPSGSEEALVVAARLRELGPRRVVITLGSRGAVYDDGESAGHVPAGHARRVVDTTGAGDATVGVLAASLAFGTGFRTAVANAMAAGARAVESEGAAASYPRFELVR